MFTRTRPRLTHGADAVVTGAGSGIGRAFAVELARRGGRVVCADISLERAEATVRMLDGPGFAVQCDVSVQSQVEDLALFAELEFGGAPTVLINNAGVGIGGKPVGSIGFGADSVSGRSRVPRPPTRMTASTSSRIRSAWQIDGGGAPAHPVTAITMMTIVARGALRRYAA